jgi:hypothetical protein
MLDSLPEECEEEEEEKKPVKEGGKACGAFQ